MFEIVKFAGLMSYNLECEFFLSKKNVGFGKRSVSKIQIASNWVEITIRTKVVN